MATGTNDIPACRAMKTMLDCYSGQVYADLGENGVMFYKPIKS